MWFVHGTAFKFDITPVWPSMVKKCHQAWWTRWTHYPDPFRRLGNLSICLGNLYCLIKSYCRLWSVQGQEDFEEGAMLSRSEQRILFRWNAWNMFGLGLWHEYLHIHRCDKIQLGLLQVESHLNPDDPSSTLDLSLNLFSFQALSESHTGLVQVTFILHRIRGHLLPFRQIWPKNYLACLHLFDCRIERGNSSGPFFWSLHVLHNGCR